MGTFLGGDMPEKCPDLSEHANFMTDALKANPGLYEQLKDKKTALDVTLGHCIKTGIDNKGHPHIKTCGIVAGDEESWPLFAPLFDHVVDARHGGYGPNDKHPTDMNIDNLSTTKVDPTGQYILTSRCRTGRSVKGFRLPPCNSFEERRKIEDIVVKDVCARMKLQARGSAGVDSASTGGTWDISNADRLGSGETTLVNTFTEGVANIIRWEKMLENGEDIEEEVAN